ncbi:MAG: transglutaminase-like domain-containing protein [Acidimicrobiales bacterium]|jgi:regulator of sirC expression with transglutaminase-like and TPR domain|nr:transglutaminase-like domain-containing protein [Acidimicrobiales bacterium]
MEVTERFAEVLAGPEAGVALDEATLLVAAHAYPGLDVAAELARIDRLADGCAVPTLDGLLRLLFDDLGFRGNRGAYYDPRNSYLNDVLDRRLGIPITLAVVTMSVGRRLGVPLAGVAMPGHFLLRDRVDPAVFVDPFAGGAQLDEAGCEAAFRRVQGHDAAFDRTFLEPVGPHAIVARLLANLRSVFAASGDRASMAWVLRLRTLVPGVPDEERAELAAVLAALGDFRAAAAEFEGAAGVLGGAFAERYALAAGRLRARLN